MLALSKQMFLGVIWRDWKFGEIWWMRASYSILKMRNNWSHVCQMRCCWTWMWLISVIYWAAVIEYSRLLLSCDWDLCELLMVRRKTSSRTCFIITFAVCLWSVHVMACVVWWWLVLVQLSSVHYRVADEESSDDFGQHNESWQCCNYSE